MILVSISLKPSAIHGLGCFANEPIAKGQITWTYDDRIDRRIPAAELEDLPQPIQDFLSVYAYAEMVGGHRVLTLCGDHSKHMNHSLDPNIILDPNGSGNEMAARDIEAGEELTCNYFSFDLDSIERNSIV